MPRTLAVGILLAAVCLGALPGALGQPLVVDVRLPAGDDPLDDPVAALADAVGSLPIAGDAAHALPRLASTGAPADARGAEPDPQPAAAASTPEDSTARTPLPPETAEAIGAATLVGGLVLLAGLAAHQWGGLVVPLFSRIQPDRVLENDVRGRVFDAVSQNPGITLKEVATVCGIGWGTAVHHLNRLEAERLVVSERNRQFRRFFRNGGGIANESKAAFGELKSPTGQRVAHAILETPGRCQKELCERVGISAPLAHKYLARLEDAGLVAAQREWKTKRYFPTPRLQDLLLVLRGPEAAPPPVEPLQPAPVALAA